MKIILASLTTFTLKILPLHDTHILPPVPINFSFSFDSLLHTVVWNFARLNYPSIYTQKYIAQSILPLQHSLTCISQYSNPSFFPLFFAGRVASSWLLWTTWRGHEGCHNNAEELSSHIYVLTNEGIVKREILSLLPLFPINLSSATFVTIVSCTTVKLENKFLSLLFLCWHKYHETLLYFRFYALYINNIFHRFFFIYKTYLSKIRSWCTTKVEALKQQQ